MQWSTRSAAQSCADGLSFTMEAQRGGERSLRSGFEDVISGVFWSLSFSVFGVESAIAS
jgi:hypothetical protein